MRHPILVLLTLMASGRAMTLAFISRAGDGAMGSPPAAWLMPLVGDALVGVAALGVAALLWKRRTPAVWLTAVVWDAIAIFDAGAAWLVEIQSPWPDFFMLELVGRAMFPAAIAMHLIILGLLLAPATRGIYGVNETASPIRR